MRNLLAVLVVLIVGVAVLGYFLDWFHLSHKNKEGTTDFHLSVDKAKIQEDTAKVKEKVVQAGEEVKESAAKADAKIKEKIHAARAGDRDTGHREESKEEYQQKTESQLREFDHHMDDLKARAERGSAQAKTAWEKDEAVLADKREAAQKKLDELKASSGQEWEKVKPDLDAAMDDLHKTYQDAAGRLSS
jgi:regulatory protein YycH of two-component signal transduction system YycFG